MGHNPIYKKLNSVIGEGPDKKSYLGEDDFVEVRYRNLRVSYHVKNRLIDLAKLLGTVRRIQEKLAGTFRIDPSPLEIEIYRDKKEWADRHTFIEEADLPSWIQGDSGRVIRIVMAEDCTTAFEKLQVMVTHECVHGILKSAFGDSLPAWLDEGLAVYFSQALPEDAVEMLLKARDADALLPIELMEGTFARMDRQVKKLAYAQSSSLVEYLKKRNGWAIIRDMLAACSRNESPEHAMRPYGLNYYLLEKEWRFSLNEL